MKTLLNLDKHAKIDVELISHLGGPGGLTALERSFTTQCAALADNTRSLSTAASNAKLVMTSDLYHMMPEGAQLQIK
eukprot:808948-Amphidinium_carterae.1